MNNLSDLLSSVNSIITAVNNISAVSKFSLRRRGLIDFRIFAIAARWQYIAKSLENQIDASGLVRVVRTSKRGEKRVSYAKPFDKFVEWTRADLERLHFYRFTLKSKPHLGSIECLSEAFTLHLELSQHLFMKSSNAYATALRR